MAGNTDPVFKAPSAVERVAQHLRAMALDLAEGDYIGSEQTLARRFEISGPTLRQAIRLLEHEGLVKVRRGVKGGYYAGRANIDTLTRAAATYLHATISSFDEVTNFIEYLLPFFIDGIIANPRLDELAAWAEPFHDETRVNFIDRQVAFLKVTMDLAGNSALQFTMTVLYQTVSTLPLEHGSDMAEGNRELEMLRAAMAQALLAKDRDRAIAAYRDSNRLVIRAIERHFKGNPAP